MKLHRPNESARWPPLALVMLAALGCSEDKRDPAQWPISRDELAGKAVGGATSDAPATAADADLTYRRYCIGCHGSDGRGGGGLTGADFTAAATFEKPEAELIASVRDGKLGKSASMPAHKPVLNEAQIAAVVHYVRERFGKASAR